MHLSVISVFLVRLNLDNLSQGQEWNIPFKASYRIGAQKAFILGMLSQKVLIILSYWGNLNVDNFETSSQHGQNGLAQPRQCW